MSAIMRWDPIREMLNMRRDMDQMFESGFFGREGMGPMVAVPMDVSETEDGYIVQVSLPGANPDDIEVTINNNTLTIRGTITADEERQDQTYHIRERRFGSFVRSITLPSNINVDRVETSFENGVLRVHMPKAEEARPKRIQVGRGKTEARSKTGQRSMTEHATTRARQTAETQTKRTR